MRFSLVIQGVPVDLFSDETIQLTREIKDFFSANAKTDFTQQFNIPSTPTNDPIFDNYFDENSVLSGWNAFLKLDAQIFIHSIPVFTGCVELTAVEFKNGLPRQYNLIFYGQGKKAIADWGERTLIDIDWSDYDHTVSYTTVIDSWFGNLLSGAVLYPVADWHIGMRYCKVPVVSNNLYSGGLAINDLRPALRFREFIEACFLDIGYTLSGTLLARDYFDKLYVIPMNGGGPVQNTGNVDAKINISIGSYTAPTGYYLFKIPFNTVVSDPLNLWNTSTRIYTATFSGRYQVQISGNVQSITRTTSFYASTSAVYNLIGSVQVVGAFSSSVFIYLNKGDKLEISQRSSGTCVFNSIVFEITEVPFGINGSTLNFSVVMPPIKVTDFINQFMQTFNAVLIPVSDTEFELHNVDDYYALGVTKEYTEYIDVTDIRHEKVPVPKQITMNHQEGENLSSVQFKNLYNREYGSMKASPEVDFSGDELEIKSPFTLLVPSVIREENTSGQIIRDTELQIPVMLDFDLKPVKSNLILAYFVERKTITTDTFQLEGVDQFSYPLMSSYQDFPTVSSTESLSFGMEATLSGNAPTMTNFVNFHQKYLSRIFSSKSRVVYFDAIIPVGEWLNLKMNDTIAVSGNYYKIQKIEYDILNEMAKLVLFSYPEVEIQTYTSTGNSSGWTNANFTPDGITTMSGDSIGRSVTNTLPFVGSGQGLTILNQSNFGESTMSYLKRAMDELLKGRSVFIAYNSDPVALNTPADNSFITIPLNTVESLGESFYYTHSGGVITINGDGRFKVTAEASIFHNKSKNLEWTIKLNNYTTTAYADLEKSDYSTSVSEVFDLNAGDEIKVAIACTENSAVALVIDWCKLRVEKL
jgi:hypothetical protein